MKSSPILKQNGGKPRRTTGKRRRRQLYKQPPRLLSLPPSRLSIADKPGAPALLQRRIFRAPPIRPRYTTPYMTPCMTPHTGPYMTPHASRPARLTWVKKLPRFRLTLRRKKQGKQSAQASGKRIKRAGRRKKRIPEPDEEDPYYGLQLKSLEEYRKDYEKTLSFQAITDEDLAAQDGEEEGAEFRYLFTKAEIRDPNEESELAKRFEEIRAAR